MFDSSKSSVTTGSFHFFLRRQLLSTITRYIKSEHYRYAYISLESIPTPSYTLLTPVGDGHRSPCLVTSCADEYKLPHLPTHAYTPHLNIYKIILSIFTPNKKIQRYYNKTSNLPKRSVVVLQDNTLASWSCEWGRAARASQTACRQMSVQR